MPNLFERMQAAVAAQMRQRFHSGVGKEVAVEPAITPSGTEQRRNDLLGRALDVRGAWERELMHNPHELEPIAIHAYYRAEISKINTALIDLQTQDPRVTARLDPNEFQRNVEAAVPQLVRLRAENSWPIARSQETSKVMDQGVSVDW